MAKATKLLPAAKAFLSIRLEAEQKRLIEQAAAREGVTLSSFIILLLVRLKILPDHNLRRLKRCPVPSYAALHGLMGVVNKIGGNCQQLAVALPTTDGLAQTQLCLIRAAAALTEALYGKKLPEAINLYQFHDVLTRVGLRFNGIVKSVNCGRPRLAALPQTLATICVHANAVTKALKGQTKEQASQAAAHPVQTTDAQEEDSQSYKDATGDDDRIPHDAAADEEALMELALAEMRQRMCRGMRQGMHEDRTRTCREQRLSGKEDT